LTGTPERVDPRRRYCRKTLLKMKEGPKGRKGGGEKVKKKVKK